MSGLTIGIERKVYRRAANGDVTAIAGLHFAVKENEFVCILGPSGCGKTTLLNLIAGMDGDFEGRIAPDPGERLRRLAYVFQTPRLLPWRTVLDNLTLAAGTEPQAVARCRDLLAEVGLSECEGAYPGELSLGMQRRAALARGFAIEPGLLLMDEPFVSLDEATADRLRGLLMTLWRERPATVLFVTHDSREAIRLAERLLVFAPSPARLLSDIAIPLTPDERARPETVEAFRREMLEPDTNVSAFPGLLRYNGNGMGTRKT